MIQLGYFAAAAGLASAVVALLLGAIAYGRNREDLLAVARNAVVACSFFTTLAVVGIVYAFLAGDFQLDYVWSHSDRDMPLVYKFTALWGGMSGSLLFWGWLLSLFSMAAMLKHRHDRVELMGPAVSVLMMVETFFLSLVVFVANPWRRAGFIPPDGQGLNPLLQHPAMAIHPPCLYLGFVGFTIPFAFAMAALISRQTGDEWIKKSRPWAILAWMFLAAGNVLGARWAYVELGWGGYWAWDPVENAAFMPWLAGTAYLHSSMIQERKGMLKIWNMLLIITTFLLTIFGTFITRSGLISSVHSFAQSNIGYVFAGFLVFMGVLAIGLLISRRHLLHSERQLDSFFSRESSFLLNNLVLLGGAAAVLWGTIFPMISEAVRGVRISVGPPFFNQIMVPIGLGLLALMGIGPLIAWKRASLASIRRAFSIPVVLAIVAGVILIVLGVSHAYALVTFSLCAFVLAAIVSEFAAGIRARRTQNKEGGGRAFLQLFRRAPRRFGGYVIHAGVVLVFLGFAGAAFTRDHEQTLSKGESMSFDGYQFTFRGFRTGQDASLETVAADVVMARDGRNVALLLPQRNWYKKNKQMASEVAIHSSMGRDLYLVLADYDLDAEKASLKAYLNPLVSWFWTGGIVIVLGGLLVLLPWQRRSAAAVILALLLGGAGISRAAGPDAAAGRCIPCAEVSRITREVVHGIARAAASGIAHVVEPARAAQPPTVESVSERLMDPCPDCKGKQLSACDCPPAAAAKEEIAQQIADGRTEAQIVQSFVDKYGEWIRSAPQKNGFNLVGYAMPFGLLLAGIGGLSLFLRRAVRRRGAAVPSGTSEEPADDAGDARRAAVAGAEAAVSTAERQRLEQELRRLD